MNTKTTLRRLAVVATLVAAAAVGSTAAFAGPEAPDVPAGIAVDEGHKLFLVGHAVGVQIYSCNGAAWTFVAPRATLYGDNGKVLIEHFGGPTWQARDGSFVKAQVDRRHEVTGAIPWLRLAATSTAAGLDGDRLEGTTFIQRIRTTGGVAPAPGTCTTENAGAIAEVDYTSDYTFWKRAG